MLPLSRSAHHRCTIMMRTPRALSFTSADAATPAMGAQPYRPSTSSQGRGVDPCLRVRCDRCGVALLHLYAAVRLLYCYNHVAARTMLGNACVHPWASTTSRPPHRTSPPWRAAHCGPYASGMDPGPVDGLRECMAAQANSPRFRLDTLYPPSCRCRNSTR